jgi:aryl-alcohol dehydrogenase-like predicted oxidoreductase
MRARALGRTGLRVSEIGFGTWGLGGSAYGPVEDAESRAALEAAFDKGVSFYDTSDLYGNGHAESILGEVFRARRDQVVIATKGGMLPHTTFVMPQDFSRGHLERALDASLHRLRTDYVDVYQLHSPPIDLPGLDEAVETLAAMKERGKVRVTSISTRSPADAIVAIERYGFGAIEVNFNMIDQRAVTTGLFAICVERGVGVIARTPLCFGYLSGALTGDEQLTPGDHRSNWPKEQLRRWAQSPRLFAPLVDGRGRTISQLALQYCLSEPAVSTVIPGMLTIPQVEENVGAIDAGPFTAGDAERIREIYASNTFYDPNAKSQSPAAAPSKSPA